MIFDVATGTMTQIPSCFQTRKSQILKSNPNLYKPLKPPILLVPQDESRLVAVIQRSTAFDDEVEKHKKKTEEEEELEVRWLSSVQGVPCPGRLGFVDLDLGCSTTLLGQ